LNPVRAAANLASQPVSRFVSKDVPRTQTPAQPPNDEELVRRTCAGERRAFDPLVERYQRRAASVAYRLLGNVHDALEVCQEAFVKAFRNIETLEEPARFGPWLLRIVTNLALNFRRDRAVGGRKVSFEDCILDGDADPPRDQRLADSPGSDERPGAAEAAREMDEVVQKAIAELPEQQRLALVLFSVEALPQRDVASIMGCSVEAVKWHVFQARKKLKERLAEHL
jgi:RNA polymerase sigma-70 factor (ECF subfamily)